MIYLHHVARTTCSKATIEEAVYAIAWAHSLAGSFFLVGLGSILRSPKIVVWISGISVGNGNAAMTIKMLQAMVQDANDTGTLANHT